MENELKMRTDEELVRLAREGSLPAEEYLIRKYKGLARVKAQHYYITGGDREDVIQEGMIGIFKAIRDYDGGGEASFRTFVDLCVTRQILTAVDQANRQKHQILNNSVSLSEPGEDADALPLVERLVAGENADPEALAMLNEVVDGLTADGVTVFSALENRVWAMMRQGMSYREIAEKLGRSPKSVDNAIQRIRKKIYQYLL